MRPSERLRQPAMAALAALVVLSAPALAQAPSFGSVVKAWDPEARPGLLAGAAAEACFTDGDGNGTAGPEELVFLRTPACAGSGKVQGLALTGPRAGTWVAVEGNLTARAATAQWGRAAGAGSPPDRWDGPLYLHLRGPGTVAPGDVRLTDGPGGFAGSRVAANHTDAGNRTQGLPGEVHLAWWDADRDGAPDADEAAWGDLDSSGTASPGDVRLRPASFAAFGSVVRAGDLDAAAVLRAVPDVRVCALDLDGDGEASVEEPLYLRTAPCPREGGVRVAVGDLRFSAPGLGTFVGPGHSDLGQPLAPVEGVGLRYADLDRDGRWSLRDALYLQRIGVRLTVGEGDVRLVAFGQLPAGSFVRAGDSDLRFLTSAAGGPGGPFEGALARAARSWDADRDQHLAAPDAVYLDLDGDGRVGLGDARVTPVGVRGAGTLVEPDDPDFAPALAPGLAGAGLCFVDGDGNGALGPSEGVYFQRRPCGRVHLDADDVRLSGLRAGTKVRVNDTDFNAETRFVPGASNLRFFDVEGDGRWGALDTLYLHFSADAARVAAGDLRLTGYGGLPAGQFVEARDTDEGLPTRPFPTAALVSEHWRPWDVDDDGVFGRADGLYLDADADGRPSPSDVRFAAADIRADAAGGPFSPIPVLQRTIEALEDALAEREAGATSLRERVAALNASLASAKADLDAARAELAALRNASAPPPRPTPEAPAAALVLAAGLLAVAVRSRR